jgi:glyoxylase I family protein
VNVIVSIHHVSLLVSDTQRALNFYHGILGLEVDQSRPVMDFPGAWLLAGTQQIHLIEMPDRARAATSAAHGGRDWHVAFAVSDLDALAAALSERGIGYTLSRSGRRALFCRDPDGNAIELVELRAD